MKCPNCKSDYVIKDGKAKRKKRSYQRYKCNSCRKRFWVIFSIVIIVILILSIYFLTRESKRIAPIQDLGESLQTLNSGTHQLSITMTDNKNNYQQGIEVERHYLVHLPTGFNPNNDYDLVIFFHGTSGNSKKSLQDTEFDDVADQKNFIVVFPQGMGELTTINNTFKNDDLGGNQNTCWNIRPDAEPGRRCYANSRQPDDDKFINILIQKFNNGLNINRLFISGFSNGCGMAQHIALTRTDIDAIGIGGCSVPGQDFLDYQRKVQTEIRMPFPILRFHATGDRVSEYMFINEQLPSGKVPTAELAIDEYAKTNNCSKPANKENLNIRSVIVEHWIYPDCDRETEFYKIEGGSHVWYSAITPIVWDFLNKT